MLKKRVLYVTLSTFFFAPQVQAGEGLFGFIGEAYEKSKQAIESATEATESYTNRALSGIGGFIREGFRKGAQDSTFDIGVSYKRVSVTGEKTVTIGIPTHAGTLGKDVTLYDGPVWSGATVTGEYNLAKGIGFTGDFYPSLTVGADYYPSLSYGNSTLSGKEVELRLGYRWYGLTFYISVGYFRDVLDAPANPSVSFSGQSSGISLGYDWDNVGFEVKSNARSSSDYSAWYAQYGDPTYAFSSAGSTSLSLVGRF